LFQAWGRTLKIAARNRRFFIERPQEAASAIALRERYFADL
jgi:hypothetical protein